MISVFQSKSGEQLRTPTVNKSTFNALHDSPFLKQDQQNGAEVSFRDPPYPVFFRAGSVVRRVLWNGGNAVDLQRMCLAAFHFTDKQINTLICEDLAEAFTCYYPATQYAVNHRLVNIADLRPGTLVEVTNIVWCVLCVLAVAGDNKGLPPNVGELMAALEPPDPNQIWMPSPQAPLRERIQIFLSEPTSSVWALRVQLVILLLILLSTITYCLQTLPMYYSPGSGFTFWAAFEAFCIACFTIELAIRFAVDYNKPVFFMSIMNAIDLASVLPFYLEQILQGSDVPGLSVLRVLRLTRLLRVLKVSRETVDLLGKTMKRSMRPLYMLIFITCIVMLLFATMIYYCERGKYNTDLGVWMRRVHYRCPYTCSSFVTNDCPPGSQGEPRFSSYTYKVGDQDDCEEIWEQSPFESIPASCWWALCTMTTVGYGDITPISTLGKFLGMVTQLCGILCIAMPVTVVGSNFTQIYERLAKASAGGVYHSDDEDDDDDEDLVIGIRAKVDPHVNALEDQVCRLIQMTVAKNAKARAASSFGLGSSNAVIPTNEGDAKSSKTTPATTPARSKSKSKVPSENNS